MTGQEILCKSAGKLPLLVINHKKVNCTESQQQMRGNKSSVILIIFNLPLGKVECIREDFIGKACLLKTARQVA